MTRIRADSSATISSLRSALSTSRLRSDSHSTIPLPAKTLPIVGEDNTELRGGGGVSEGSSTGGLALPPDVHYKGITRPQSAHVSWGRPPSYVNIGSSGVPVRESDPQE